MLVKRPADNPGAHADNHMEHRCHDQGRPGQALGAVKNEDRQQEYTDG